MARTVIIQQPSDDGSGYLIAIVLLIIFAIVFWYWAVPAAKSPTEIIVPNKTIIIQTTPVPTTQVPKATY